MAAGRQFRIKQISIDNHFELSALCGDERKAGDLRFVKPEQVSRQTDGLFGVMSHRAVGNGNL